MSPVYANNKTKLLKYNWTGRCSVPFLQYRLHTYKTNERTKKTLQQANSLSLCRYHSFTLFVSSKIHTSTMFVMKRKQTAAYAWRWRKIEKEMENDREKEMTGNVGALK